MELRSTLNWYLFLTREVIRGLQGFDFLLSFALTRLQNSNLTLGIYQQTIYSIHLFLPSPQNIWLDLKILKKKKSYINIGADIEDNRESRIMFLP
jgi:hypothetical protein